MAEVEGAIESIRGSVLEPFILQPRSRDVVVMLVRAAFSHELGITRFRVAPDCDRIGEGGAVITNNLRWYFVERSLFGRPTTPPASGWALMLGLVPTLDPCWDFAESARVVVDDQGTRIGIKWPGPSDGIALDECLRRSCIPSTGRSFAQLGLRVAIKDGMLTITPGSSEATVRLLALCGRSEVVHIWRPQASSALPEGRTMVKLLYPSVGDGVAVPLLHTVADGWSQSWLQTSVPPGSPGIESRLN